MSSGLLRVSGSVGRCGRECDRKVESIFILFHSTVAGLVAGRLGISFGCCCMALKVRMRPGMLTRTSRLGSVIQGGCPDTAVSMRFMATSRLVLLCGDRPSIGVAVALTSRTVALNGRGRCIALVGVTGCCGFVASSSNGLLGNVFRSGIHSCRKGGSMGSYVTGALGGGGTRSF